MALEAYVAGINILLADDTRTRDEIVLIDVIADCPDDARSRGLGPRLGPELHRPLIAMNVLDDDLLLCAAFFAAHICEGHRRIGRALTPAGAVKQVAAFDVYGRLPQDRAIVDVRIGDGLRVLRL